MLEGLTQGGRMKLRYYRYSATHGLEKMRTRIAIIVTAAGLAVGGGSGLASMALAMAHAAPHATSTSITTHASVPFVLSEWTPDRTAPSGGASVEDFGARTGTLRMGVDTTKQSTVASFYYYEGLKHDLAGASAVSADLYVASSWSTQKVRAGIWGVGQDSSSAVSAYPIVEYTTDGDGGYHGWRVFNDDAGGWTLLPGIAANTDGWNKVSIVFNPTTTLFDLYINGQSAGSNVATGSVSLSSVILNNYNYGAAGSNYDVHWSNLTVGAGETTSDKNACMNGGWQTATSDKGQSFKNQGACVSYLASNGKS